MIVWAAVLVLLTSTGPGTSISDAFLTEAACKDYVAKSKKLIDSPEGDTVIAYGLTCAQIDLGARGARRDPRMSIPKPNSMGDTGEYET